MWCVLGSYVSVKIRLIIRFRKKHSCCHICCDFGYLCFLKGILELQIGLGGGQVALHLHDLQFLGWSAIRIGHLVDCLQSGFARLLIVCSQGLQESQCKGLLLQQTTLTTLCADHNNKTRTSTPTIPSLNSKICSKHTLASCCSMQLCTTLVNVVLNSGSGY